MKKKIALLLILLVVCMSVFTGCNLFVRDDQSYYEATVAAITFTDKKTGKQEVENISRRDLIVAYNSYGVQYEQNYGYDHSQAIQESLTTLVNQKLVKRAVEDYYKELNDENQPLLNDRETTYLWDSTYNALYNNLKEYYYTASGAKAPASAEEPKTKLFTEYSPNATLLETTQTKSDGKTETVYSIKTQEVDADKTVRKIYPSRQESGVAVDYEYKNGSDVQIFRDKMFEILITANTDQSTADSKSVAQWNKAYHDYVADIKENYDYKNFANDKEAFLFEMDRVYNILKDNYFAEKYTEIYKFQNGNNNISFVTVENILKRYTQMVKADFNTYGADKAAFDSAIVSNASGIDYVYEGSDAANFFNVAYIKIALSDEAKEEIESIKQNPLYSSEQKNNLIQAYYDQLKVDVLDEYGNPAVDEKGNNLPSLSPTQLLENIQNDIANASGDYAKAEAFRKYLYQYNDDTSLHNATANAVFGIDHDGKTVLASSTFADNDAENESEFEKAITALYYGKNNDGNAEIGDTTNLVQVDGEGLYIFFYAGKLQNLFQVNDDFDAASHLENIKKLASTRQNIFSNKTIFDVIYDQLSQNDPFQSYQSEHIKQLTYEIQSLKNRDENGEKIVLETVNCQYFDKNLKGL